MFAKVWSATLLGLKALQVAIEVDVAGGLPQTVLVGLPDTAVQESKERVRAAIKNSGFAVPQRKVIINLAPADVRKEGPSFDLPIALGILLASSQLEAPLLNNTLCLGELSLDGSLRPVAGVLPIVAAAKSMGIERVVVPAANGIEASMVDGIDVFAFASLQEVAEWAIASTTTVHPLENLAGPLQSESALAVPDLADVKGQMLARRALEVAAAGGHNLLLVGSPGAGKTMLAKRLPGLLPPLTWSEVLEVTQVYSVAGLLRQRGNGSGRASIVSDRPFRAPHHSASGVALVGGGSYPRPGEISLAHNGVLFLDELTEFRREVLEVLRQPLEDGHISISRAKHSVEYPARTTLVASTNPCRCGYYGDPVVACTCTPTQRDRYWSKLSGPLLDRIDLHVRVNRLKPEEMMSVQLGESSAAVRARVLDARQRQQERFQQESTLTCNAHMQSRHLRTWCQLDSNSRQLLEGAIRKLSLSARGTDRLLKISRTIADLAGTDCIEPGHIAEAIQYRSLDRAA